MVLYDTAEVNVIQKALFHCGEITAIFPFSTLEERNNGETH